MPSIEDLPRALWGVQPEAVEQHVTEMAERCRQLESEVEGWRRRALRAEAGLQTARASGGRAPAGESRTPALDAERDASGSRRRLQSEAAAERARWEKELRQAEEELATTRAQIDALRKDFLSLLEGVSAAVAQRANDGPSPGSAAR